MSLDLLVIIISHSIVVLGSYFIGSISMAILVCSLLDLPDPTQYGSKNPGATNVLRLGGKGPAAFTLIGDLLKGFLPVLFVRLIGFSPLLTVLVLLAAVLGHMYPIYYDFKGGKGVATSFGGFLGIGFAFGGLLGLVWLVVALITRISSLAALLAIIVAPLIALWLLHWVYAAGLAILALLIVFKHKTNIERIFSGDEPKIGEK